MLLADEVDCTSLLLYFKRKSHVWLILILYQSEYTVEGAVYIVSNFIQEFDVFGAVPVRKKKWNFLLIRAGFDVFPGLPGALLLYAWTLIGRTDGP